MAGVRLIDRGAEKQALSGVLESVRQGMSGALVLRGEPGVGKSALLDYAVELAGDMQVVRTVAVESEKGLGFAAVHQLLVPFLPAVERLPDPQRRALRVAFGLVSGPPADPFLVGLAVLTLLSDAAETRPVLCVIDDAQWLDEESAHLLSFVARRLLADGVGLLFAVRETADAEPCLQALPELRICGLPEQAAYELLKTSINRTIDPPVAARIVAETGGNPLAVVEAARELTPEQLGGRVPLPEPLPVGHRLERSFLRRVRELPAHTQALLLLAAAGSPGQGHLLGQAAAALRIPEAAAAPAEAAGLVVFWPEVRFFHPLVRSAIYHAATADQQRQAHRALADACDPERDAVPRAWHLAAAAARPDEGVAAELEAAAERARSRGGYAATATLLECAAQLTPDEQIPSRAKLSQPRPTCSRGPSIEPMPCWARPPGAWGIRCRPRRPLGLRGRIHATCGRVAEAVAALVDAAERLRPLDPRAARDALLWALESAAFAGWASSASLLDEIGRMARNLPPPGDPPDSAPNLLLRGYTARLTDGYAAGCSRRCAAPSRPSSRRTWTPRTPSVASSWPPSPQPICSTMRQWSD